MGGRRLAGEPDGGSEGAEVGYPESLPEGSWDIHGKSLTLACSREQRCHHVNLVRMILRDGFEYGVRRRLDALLNTHQDLSLIHI